MNRFRDMLVGIFMGFLLVAFFVCVLASRGSTFLQGFLKRFKEDPTVVDFRLLGPEGTKVSAIQRLDTDGDTWQEWVVFYQYDIVGRNNPISGVIYDRVGRGQPIVYPYKLRTPDSDYLGEGAVLIAMQDILIDPEGEAQPRAELLVTDGRTLAVFRLREVVEQVDPTCQNFPNPYLCEGFFKGNLRVGRDGATVNVWDRAGSERSQFALRRAYKPSRGSYFQPGTVTLLPPAEASIEFAFGMPDDILNTPYPEKLVLAFYKQLVGGDVKPYLTEQARQRWDAGQLDYGAPWTGENLKRVLVQEISYTPGAEDTASALASGTQPQAAQVYVKVLFVGPGGEERRRSIQWHLVRQDNRWRMHDAASS